MTFNCVAVKCPCPSRLAGTWRAYSGSDQPAYKDRGEQRDMLELEVAVPGDRHERVGCDQEQDDGQNGFHGYVAVGERGTEAYYEKAHEQLPVGFVVAVQRSLRRVDGDLRLGLHLGDDGLAQPHGV